MKIKINNYLLVVKKEVLSSPSSIQHICVKFGQYTFYDLEEYYNFDSDIFESYFNFYDFSIYSKNNSSWLYFLYPLNYPPKDVTKLDLTNRIIFILNYLFDFLCLKF